MKAPLEGERRIYRISLNIKKFPDVQRMRPGDEQGKVTICGYGPSLADTWKDISGPVITTSGAHDFMISRGVIPKYHVECDPRHHKIEFIKNSHPDVTYLINSQCHPLMFEALIRRKRKIIMWHGFTDDDVKNQIDAVESLEPGSRLIGGGTNAGMRAITVARELGFTGFELHGIDCCYRENQQWAGEHLGMHHKSVIIDVDGKHFRTSDIMMQSTDDFINMMRMLEGCSFRIHGDGLLEARMQMFMRDQQKAINWGWWRPVNFSVREPVKFLMDEVA